MKVVYKHFLEKYRSFYVMCLVIMFFISGALAIFSLDTYDSTLLGYISFEMPANVHSIRMLPDTEISNNQLKVVTNELEKYSYATKLDYLPSERDDMVLNNRFLYINNIEQFEEEKGYISYQDFGDMKLDHRVVNFGKVNLEPKEYTKNNNKKLYRLAYSYYINHGDIIYYISSADELLDLLNDELVDYEFKSYAAKEFLNDIRLFNMTEDEVKSLENFLTRIFPSSYLYINKVDYRKRNFLYGTVSALVRYAMLLFIALFSYYFMIKTLFKRLEADDFMHTILYNSTKYNKSLSLFVKIFSGVVVIESLSVILMKRWFFVEMTWYYESGRTVKIYDISAFRFYLAVVLIIKLIALLMLINRYRKSRKEVS